MVRTLRLLALLILLSVPAIAHAASSLDRGWGALKLGATEADLAKAGGKMACAPTTTLALIDHASHAAVETKAPGVELCTLTYAKGTNEFLDGAQAVLQDGKAVALELYYKPDVGSYKAVVARSISTYGKPTATEEIGGTSYAVWEKPPTRMLLFTASDPRGKPAVHARYEDTAAIAGLLAGSAPAPAPPK